MTGFQRLVLMLLIKPTFRWLTTPHIVLKAGFEHQIFAMANLLVT